VFALSLVAVGILTPNAVADSISVAADQPVHALGEPVIMTVSYMGGVHGDIKLTFEDSVGTVMNEWTWDHASSDPFQQVVSYTPANAGTYNIKVLHQPHHMEPPASMSVQTSFWSARVVGMQYAGSVDAGKPLDLTATVNYYFTQPTQVKLELWSKSEGTMLGTITDTLNGQGTKAATFSGVQFTSIQDQEIEAQVHYQMPSGWSHDTTGSTYSGKITVVPEFSQAPAVITAMILLSLAFLRRRITRA